MTAYESEDDGDIGKEEEQAGGPHGGKGRLPPDLEVQRPQVPVELRRGEGAG